MMRILFVTPYGGVPGGISRWAGHIIKYYQDLSISDIQLDLVSMGRSMFVNINSPLLYRLKSAYIDYKKIFQDFHEKLTTNRYDVMHLTSSASLSLYKDFYLLSKAKHYGVKTVIHFRFGRIPELSKKKNWEWRMLCRVIKLADKVIVIDKQSFDVLTNIGCTNIELLPNPISPSIKEIIEKDPFIRRVPRSILFVGHVVKTKGVFELIEACKQIPNIELRLVGHVLPEVKIELEQKVENATWLHIEGEKAYDEVIKEMLRCDIFVLPTYTEGFPNVILESMACGNAIIASRVGAIPEMLETENGKPYGVLIDPKDSIQIKEAIIDLIDDEEKKNEMRFNVKQRVYERYDISIVWKSMINIWTSAKKTKTNDAAFER